MRYEKKAILTADRNPHGGRDREVPEFMVGVDAVLSWKSGQSEDGSDSNELRPAYCAEMEGRCWLHSWVWWPAQGCSAQGNGSELLPFADGVELLVNHEVFGFPLSMDNETDNHFVVEEYGRVLVSISTPLNVSSAELTSALSCWEGEFYQTAARLAPGALIDRDEPYGWASERPKPGDE